MRLRGPWLALLALVLLAGCDNGLHLPGTPGDAPTSLTARDEATSVKGSIYIAQAGRIWKLHGGKLKVLTPGSETLAYPTASADGSVTAVSVIGRGQAQIAVGGPDFTGLAPLSAPKADPQKASLDLKPALSPDGKRLVFMSDRSGCCSDEAIWEGPVRQPHEVSFPPDMSGGDDAPAYLPDVSGIVFVAWRSNRGNLDKAVVPGGRVRVVVTGAPSDILDPAPGPGGKMAWVSRQGDTADIVVGNVDGTGAATVANFADCRQPVWSPDGRSLLFLSGHGGTTDLWLVPAGGGAPQRLTWGADLDANSHPAWTA